MTNDSIQYNALSSGENEVAAREPPPRLSWSSNRLLLAVVAGTLSLLLVAAIYYSHSAQPTNKQYPTMTSTNLHSHADESAPEGYFHQFDAHRIDVYPELHDSEGLPLELEDPHDR